MWDLETCMCMEDEILQKWERKGEGENLADLFFVEHGNLNKDDGEVGVAEFLVFLEGFELVALVGFLPEEFDEDDDNAHVNPLHEEHEGHGEANVHRQVEQRHDERRLYDLPDHPHLCRDVEIDALDWLRDEELWLWINHSGERKWEEKVEGMKVLEDVWRCELFVWRWNGNKNLQCPCWEWHLCCRSLSPKHGKNFLSAFSSVSHNLCLSMLLFSITFLSQCYRHRRIEAFWTEKVSERKKQRK